MEPRLLSTLSNRESISIRNVRWTPRNKNFQKKVFSLSNACLHFHQSENVHRHCRTWTRFSLREKKTGLLIWQVRLPVRKLTLFGLIERHLNVISWPGLKITKSSFTIKFKGKLINLPSRITSCALILGEDFMFMSNRLSSFKFMLNFKQSLIKIWWVKNKTYVSNRIPYRRLIWEWVWLGRKLWKSVSDEQSKLLSNSKSKLLKEPMN